jgi:hypothetical protein
MSFITALNFIDHRGRSGLAKFRELSREGKTLAEIGKEFGFSLQRTSILRRQLLKKSWDYSEETVDALRFNKHTAEHDIKEVDEMLEDEKILVLKQ